MLTPTERQNLTRKLAALPQQIDEAVRGLNDAQLDTPCAEGEWTPRQIVHHLADSHMMAFGRIKTMLTEDRPAITLYSQDAFAASPDAQHGPIEPSLAILHGLHQRWSALLAALPDADWQRVLIHPRRGELSVDDMVVTYTNHGDDHVGQIARLRAAKGW